MSSVALRLAALIVCAAAAERGGVEGGRSSRALRSPAHARQRARGAAALAALRGGSAPSGDDDGDDEDAADELVVEDAVQLKALGNELVKAQDYAGAAAKYQEALRELDFDGSGSRRAAALDRRLRLNLASCLLRLGDPERAAEQCTAVLSHFAGCYRALSKRAQAYEASGALVDAAEDYRAAAELAPAAEGALLAERADLLEQLGAGGGAGLGGDGQGGLADMAGLLGMGGGGGGLGGLAALAESSGLLPPAARRLLRALQAALRAKAAAERAWQRLAPVRPYLLGAALLYPLARAVWRRCGAALLPLLGLGGRAAQRRGSVTRAPGASPAVAVACLDLARRTGAEPARSRATDSALLLGAALHARRGSGS